MPQRAEKYRRMELRRDIGNRNFGFAVRTFSSTVRGYLIAHACFECRVSYKRVPRDEQVATCPECRGPAYQMGRSFKAPPRSNEEQWLKVRILFAYGFRFFSYRSRDCPALPSTLHELEDFLREYPEHPFRIANPQLDLLPTGVAERMTNAPRPR